MKGVFVTFIYNIQAHSRQIIELPALLRSVVLSQDRKNSFLASVSHQERNKLEETFNFAMQSARDIFDNDAFRKRYGVTVRRTPINGALFETWRVGLAKCSPTQIKRLIDKKKQVKDDLIELLEHDQEFIDSISYSTGSPQRVKKRFKTVENFIQEQLAC